MTFFTKNNTHRSVVERYNDPRVSNGNMLHPGLYKYITSPHRKELIVYYDKQKYDQRKRKRIKLIGNRDWGGSDNALHKNKKFIGIEGRSPTAKKALKLPGTVDRKTKSWLLNSHGLVVPKISANYFSGLYCGEGSISVSLHKKKNLRRAFGVGQNYRNIHLLFRSSVLFGSTGSVTSGSVWNNKSTYGWGVTSLNNLVEVVVPQIRSQNFYTIKQKELALLCERVDMWCKGYRPFDIVADCGSEAKKTLVVNRENEGIPNVSADFIRGVVDGDGSITQTDGNPYLIVTQKDPYLLQILHKYFNGRGKVVLRHGGESSRYVLSYKTNLNQANDFFMERRFKRTDLVVKHNYLLHRGFDNLAPICKQPEYVPSGRAQLHRLLRNGVDLPDSLVERQHEFYPLELMLYYKEIYKNLYNERSISSDLLPFKHSLVIFYLYIYFFY